MSRCHQCCCSDTPPGQRFSELEENVRFNMLSAMTLFILAGLRRNPTPTLIDSGITLSKVITQQCQHSPFKEEHALLLFNLIKIGKIPDHVKFESCDVLVDVDRLDSITVQGIDFTILTE